MGLWDYVKEKSMRGACTCGKCIDAPKNPEKLQPKGHTANLIFFKVVKRDNPDANEFRKLVEKEFPPWLDGKEHNYLECGGDMGDQGMALQTMGLGSLLGVWNLYTPENMLPSATDEFKRKLAGQGMITVQLKEKK